MADSRNLELRARRFRALGDPLRLGIVERLAAGPCCVCDLKDRFGTAGPLLSHHLGVLRDAGIVTATRQGRWVHYALDHDTVAELLTTTATETHPVGVP